MDQNQMKAVGTDVGLDPMTILTIVRDVRALIELLRQIFGPKPTVGFQGAGGEVTSDDVKDILAGLTALERIIANRVTNPQVAALIAALATLNEQPWFEDFIVNLANRLGTNPTEGQVMAMMAASMQARPGQPGVSKP